MNPCELAASITAIACTIAKDKDSQDISLLANVFTQLGDTLATIAAQMDACKDNN